MPRWNFFRHHVRSCQEISPAPLLKGSLSLSMDQSSPEPMMENTSVSRPDLLVGQQLPPLPQQKRSKQKRDALLQAALALFAERGYEATTIEEIAHQAGVAVGGFYQHFASKRQLLLVLMDRLLDEIAAFSLNVSSSDAQPVSARAIILEVVRQGLLVDWAYVGAYRAWREAVVLAQELRVLHEQLERWTTQQIKLLIYFLLQLPQVRQDVNVDELAWIISLLFWRLAEVPLQEPDTVVESVTNLIYHALFTDEPV